MKHTLRKVTERKCDHYGTTSRHDKKDEKKETEASKEEETETTEEIIKKTCTANIL
jgi:hypothetical protein